MVISCATTIWKGRVVQFMWLHYGERVEIISMCILSVFSLCSDVNVFITSLRFSIVVMDLDGAKFFLWGIVFWLRVGIYEKVVV